MFGIGKRMRERVKGVGFEQRERMLEKLVRHPGDGPCVQPGVAVVEPRECGRVKRKRELRSKVATAKTSAAQSRRTPLSLRAGAAHARRRVRSIL